MWKKTEEGFSDGKKANSIWGLLWKYYWTEQVEAAKEDIFITTGRYNKCIIYERNA